MERKLFLCIFVFGCLHKSSVKGKIVSQLPPYLPSGTEHNVERNLGTVKHVNLGLTNWITDETKTALRKGRVLTFAAEFK